MIFHYKCPITGCWVPLGVRYFCTISVGRSRADQYIYRYVIRGR
jgi:hypothetical protein